MIRRRCCTPRRAGTNQDGRSHEFHEWYELPLLASWNSCNSWQGRSPCSLCKNLTAKILRLRCASLRSSQFQSVSVFAPRSTRPVGTAKTVPGKANAFGGQERLHFVPDRVKSVACRGCCVNGRRRISRREGQNRHWGVVWHKQSQVWGWPCAG